MSAQRAFTPVSNKTPTISVLRLRGSTSGGSGYGSVKITNDFERDVQFCILIVRYTFYITLSHFVRGFVTLDF